MSSKVIYISGQLAREEALSMYYMGRPLRMQVSRAISAPKWIFEHAFLLLMAIHPALINL
jgi:enamine deaminase RidA (YjgF/YER057c/UK114 family)